MIQLLLLLTLKFPSYSPIWINKQIKKTSNTPTIFQSPSFLNLKKLRFHLISYMASNKHFPLLLLLITITTTSSTSLASDQDKLVIKIIDAMISGGSFEDWSPAFLATNDEIHGQVLTSTLFLPKTPVEGINATSPLVAAYHIVPQLLHFYNITLMEPLSRIPTLLSGNSILVTNNSASGFTLDGVLVSEPDLFVSPSIVIHRIASPFNFSRYGGDDLY